MSFATPIVMAPIVGSSALAMSYLGVNHYVLNSPNNVDLAVFKPVPSSIKEEHEEPTIPHLTLHKEEAMFEFDLSKYGYPWNGLIIQRLDEQPAGTYDYWKKATRSYFFNYKNGKSYKITIYRKIPPADEKLFSCLIDSRSSSKSSKSSDSSCDFDLEYFCYLTWDYVDNVSDTVEEGDFIVDNNNEKTNFKKNFRIVNPDNSVAQLPEIFTLAKHDANREDCTAISLDNVAFVKI